VGTSTNAGTIELANTSDLNLQGYTLTNTGTIDLQSSLSIGSTISSGTLVNNGNLILEPGAPVSISGPYSQGTHGTLTTYLDSPTDIGSVNVGSTATLAGTLVAFTNYTPAPTASVTVMTSGGLSTQFGSEDYHGYADWSTAYPNNNVVLTFESLAVSPTSSKVSADPLAVPADGVTSSTVTVTLYDSQMDPVVGKTMALAQGGGSNSVITPETPVTNASGQATFTVTDTTAEVVHYAATDVSDGLELPESATVDFVPGAVSPTNSSISASPLGPSRRVDLINRHDHPARRGQ
jgi:hypothetical protein